MDQFIFGYGSLIERESRCRTVPSAVHASPVVVEDLARRWDARSTRLGAGITYLGAGFAAGKECNGVLFKVDAAIQATDKRERSYSRERLDAAQIRMLDGSDRPPDGDIWVYIYPKGKAPDAAYPIMQSYVDICLSGCLEVEEEFGGAGAADFAACFIRATADWSSHWVNDRAHPRRTQSYVPKLHIIDALLHEHLNEFFDLIK
jgi:hypothetical protein